MTDIQVNDIGTVFEILLTDEGIALDISSASEKVLYIKKPDGTVLTKTPTFVTDGADGKLQYAIIAEDLSLKGTYKLQAKITLPSGVWSSSVTSFKVLTNLV
jgi:hypothetical protein